MSHSELIDITIFVVMTLGFFAFMFSEKLHVSSIPVLIGLGLLFGPVFGFIPFHQGYTIFSYARVFGLVLILYTEGHNLKWEMIKKHFKSIGLLATVGLLITATIGGTLFCWVFDLPLGAGMLFGSIIAATDPATLIPLFKQNKVDENIKTVIVTESIFNDPLGIVFITLTIALVAPHASIAQPVEQIAAHTTIYPAVFIFFLYEVISALLIGIILGVSGYWTIRLFKPGLSPQIFGLAIAFGGFLIGEAAKTSGYLVATTIGIIFGNHALIFKKWGENEGFVKFVKKEMRFNEVLSDLSSVFIFILLGATIDLTTLSSTIIKGIILGLGIVFIARPISGLVILPLKKWSFKEYMFISLEGPKGVVPAAMAGLPLSLGIANHNQTLIEWGHIIMSATIVTVLVTVLVETVWMKPLAKKLLKPQEETE